MWYRLVGIIGLMVILSGCKGEVEANAADPKETKYQYALSILKNDWEGAEKSLSELGDYKDSIILINYLKARLTIKNTATDDLKSKGYPTALGYLSKIPESYNDSFSNDIKEFRSDMITRNSEFSFISSSPSVDPNAPKPVDYSKLKPQVGMTAEEVVKTSWGKPQDINKTTTAYGVSEQWVYAIGKYVYLDDGIVTAIQE